MCWTTAATSSGGESPLPPPAQPARHVAVTRVQVTSDADREAIVQAGVPPGPRPAHQEVVRTVAQDEVRDHLLPASIHLSGGPPAEPALPVDEGLERLRVGRPDPRPARGVHDDGAREAEEPLLRDH